MATSNQYSPQTVALDGGLDFITPRLTAPPGSLTECFNFERTDRVGYTRISGYEPYDAGLSPSLAYTNMVVLTVDESSAGPDDIRDPVWITPSAGEDAVVLGYLCIPPDDDGYIVVAITNYEEWEKIQRVTPPNIYPQLSTAKGTYTISSVSSFDDFFETPASYNNAKEKANLRNAYFGPISADVGYPGELSNVEDDTAPVIGLHWYKDRLYAIKDLAVLYFESGSEQVYANDEIGKTEPELTVLDVQLESGAWGDGDAAGFFLVNANPTDDGSYSIFRPGSTTLSDAFTLISAPSSVKAPWQAGMWVASSYQQSLDLSTTAGWSPVTLGYALDFENGTSYGPPRIYRRGKFSIYTTDVLQNKQFCTGGTLVQPSSTSGAISNDTIALVSASTIQEAMDNDVDDTKFIRKLCENSLAHTGAGENYSSGLINLSGYAAYASSDNVEIEGLEVKIRARGAALNTADPGDPSNASRTGSVFVGFRNETLVPGGWAGQAVGTGDLFASTIAAGGSFQEFVFGGPTDLFEMTPEVAKAVMTSDFRVSLMPSVGSTGGSVPHRNGQVDISYCEFTVYFTAEISDYYFYNGVDDVTAKVTAVSLTDGDWSTNDGEGLLQVVDITPVGSATRQTINAGDEMWTEPGGTGLHILDVATDMVYNGLDTLADIEEANSRYELITANFYGNAEYESIYGVSGAGRAFSYDGFYFNRIAAIPDSSLDLPRHIAFHQFHLALGYTSGAVLLSAVGDPQNFSGVDGAAEIDVGDSITGLVRMDGTTLGIFCKNTIHGLVGTSVDNFSTSVLSPYEGAIEYTIVDIGRPVYCSYRGISLFEQTAAYGDFAGQRLSFKVSPWLLPRLQGQTPPIGARARGQGPVVAIPVRSKNQYRLFFEDGYCLVMTLVGTEKAPVFTISALRMYYEDDEGATTFFGDMVPRAESSSVDEQGAERVFVSHYSHSYTSPVPPYVYELERSWSFNGQGIPAYVVSTDNFYGSLFDFDIIRKMRVHGVSYGYAPLDCVIKSDYNSNTEPAPSTALIQNVNLPRKPAAALEQTPVTNIGNFATRGRSFSLRFMSYDRETFSTLSVDPVYADFCPPFVIQGLLIQTNDAKGDV
jgi:hypothetical protein